MHRPRHKRSCSSPGPGHAGALPVGPCNPAPAVAPHRLFSVSLLPKHLGICSPQALLNGPHTRVRVDMATAPAPGGLVSPKGKGRGGASQTGMMNFFKGAPPLQCLHAERLASKCPALWKPLAEWCYALTPK